MDGRKLTWLSELLLLLGRNFFPPFRISYSEFEKNWSQAIMDVVFRLFARESKEEEVVGRSSKQS